MSKEDIDCLILSPLHLSENICKKIDIFINIGIEREKDESDPDYYSRVIVMLGIEFLSRLECRTINIYDKIHEDD